jgi:AAA-like domain
MNTKNRHLDAGQKPSHSDIWNRYVDHMQSCWGNMGVQPETAEQTFGQSSPMALIEGRNTQGNQVTTMIRAKARQDSRVKIRLFGPFGIWIDGQRVFGLHRREGERLLAYLVLHAGEPVTYRTLASLFWPSEAYAGVDGGTTFQSTRQAVRSLRVALGAEAKRLVSVGKGIIWLDLAGVDVDLTRFDYCAQNSSDTTLRAEAIAIHTAPLLEEWQDSWVQEARQRRLRSLNRMLALQAQDAPVADADEPSSTFKFEGARTISADTHVANSDFPHSGNAGGALDLAARSYTPRRCDLQFAGAIHSGDGTILIKGGVQSGKSSLLARGLQHARALGRRVALTDINILSEAELTNTNSFYRALAVNLSLQLCLEFDPVRQWIPHLGPGMNLEQFIRKNVLPTADSSLLWAIDDADRIFRYPFADEFFGLLRSWHNRRALDPTGPWQSLSLTLAYSSEASLFIRDVNQSPFNVGTRIVVEPFNDMEMLDINCRFGEPLHGAGQIKELKMLTGGNPYLVRTTLEAISNRVVTLQDLISCTNCEEILKLVGAFERHLKRIFADIKQDPNLENGVVSIIENMPCSRETILRLAGAGIVEGDWSQTPKFACGMYAQYFKHLHENKMLELHPSM